MLPPGAPAWVLDAGEGRVSLHPDEILLAVGDLGRTSARNTWHGTVRKLTPVAGRVFVQVDIGQLVSVEVTQSAIDELGIAPGVEVTCLVKTTAMRWVG